MAPELISMGVSSILGFGMKIWAQNQADKQRQMELLIQRERLVEDTRQAAAGRGGVWIRRFIVLVVFSLLVFIITAPAIDSSIITNMIETKENGFIMSLFFGDKETIVTPVEGLVYDATFRSMLSSIIGFYFGSAAGSR